MHHLSKQTRSIQTTTFPGHFIINITLRVFEDPHLHLSYPALHPPYPHRPILTALSSLPYPHCPILNGHLLVSGIRSHYGFEGLDRHVGCRLHILIVDLGTHADATSSTEVWTCVNIK